MRSMLKVVKRASVMALALIAVICVALPVQAGDIMFTTSEKDGSKIWEGGGTIDLKGPVSLKVKNTLAAEHGLSIDTMKVNEVIKAGEKRPSRCPLRTSTRPFLSTRPTANYTPSTCPP